MRRRASSNHLVPPLAALVAPQRTFPLDQNAAARPAKAAFRHDCKPQRRRKICCANEPRFSCNCTKVCWRSRYLRKDVSIAACSTEPSGPPDLGSGATSIALWLWFGIGSWLFHQHAKSCGLQIMIFKSVAEVFQLPPYLGPVSLQPDQVSLQHAIICKYDVECGPVAFRPHDRLPRKQIIVCQLREFATKYGCRSGPGHFSRGLSAKNCGEKGHHGKHLQC